MSLWKSKLHLIIALVAGLGGLAVVLYVLFWMLTALCTWNKFENYLVKELINSPCIGGASHSSEDKKDSLPTDGSPENAITEQALIKHQHYPTTSVDTDKIVDQSRSGNWNIQ